MNLAETMVYRAVARGNRVWRVPLRPDGGVAKVGVFVQLSGEWGGPAGLALPELPARVHPLLRV